MNPCNSCGALVADEDLFEARGGYCAPCSVDTTEPVAIMAHDRATMRALYGCALDMRTVRNVRDLVPALRRSEAFTPAEVDAAVLAFEARVMDAEAMQANARG